MTTHKFNNLVSPRWIALMFAIPLIALAHYALAQPAVTGTVKFDHVQTGFNLTGSHIQAPCTSCHIQGVFKGTPRDCASCHFVGNRMGASAKPAMHIATFAKCDSCHKTTVWSDATFSHVGLAPGSCLTCHNGTTTTGKPNGHVPTSGSCDICHTTTISWQQVTFNHTGIVSGCVNCHNGQSFNGVTPVSKPSNHIPTSQDCSACHTSTSTFTSSSGTTLPANHLPTMQSCGICHNSAGFVPGIMNHLGIVSGCVSCHGGQSFLGVTPMSKSNTHMATSAPCETCHTSTTTFLLASGTTMPAGHLPSSQVCSTCHSSASFIPGVMNHAGIVNGCASCHGGQSFTGVKPVAKPTNHLPTSAACETCHSTSNFTSFSGTTMSHAGIVNGCASCHNGQSFVGVTPLPKPTNHLPTSAACETCHSSSNYATFSGTTMSHAGILTGCANCHNGQVFAGVTPVSKSSYPSHIATTADCSNCHTSTVTFATASGGTMPSNHLPTTQACSICHSSTNFVPGVMNHSGIVSGCVNCHGGQSFAGVTPVSKPSNHLPTSAACETCHSASKFTSFSGTSMIHTGILSGCASCHNGQVFAGVAPVSKPTNHLPTSAACETCHSASKFTSFSGTSMIHTGIVNGCANCHNGQVFAGVTPVSKPTNHLPTSLACETCHSSSKFTSFSGTSMNHTGIVNNCALCHNGQSFAGVVPVSKPSNHIPYATALLGGASMGCEFCHTPTVFTSFTSLVSSTTMHNGSRGGGSSGLCVTCHLSGTSYLGSMQKKSHNGASASKDCSSSSCHKPVGSKGTSYINWD